MTITFTIEVEDHDPTDGISITNKEANKILSDMEEVIGKRSLSLYDSHWERED